MTRFAYRAATAAGVVVKGVAEAPSTSELVRRLARERLFVTEIREEWSGGRRWRLLSGGARRLDLAEALRTLSVLLEAGLPAAVALREAALGASHPDVRRAFESAHVAVLRGESLHAALAEAPGAPPVAVGLVEAGERGGRLAGGVGRAAEVVERRNEFRARLHASLAYPAVIALAALSATALLVFWVLPRFVETLEEAAISLPLSTRALVFVGDAAPWIGVALAVLAATAAVAYSRAVKTEEGRLRIAERLLAAPLIGDLRAYRAGAEFSRTAGALVEEGYPLVQAIRIGANTCGDPAVQRPLLAAADAVRQGQSFGAALRAEGRLPAQVARLAEVGGSTGDLAPMLLRAADLLERSLERRLARLVALVEPALILAFGVLVGLVAIAILQAIYGVQADAF